MRASQVHEVEPAAFDCLRGQKASGFVGDNRQKEAEGRETLKTRPSAQLSQRGCKRVRYGPSLKGSGCDAR